MVIKEVFLDMARTNKNVLLSVYMNPSPDEMRKYVALGARGFVDVKGNVYFEGYEEGHQYEDNISQILHGVLLRVLHNKSTAIVGSVEKSWSCNDGKYGITIQRYMNSNDIYVGESVSSIVDEGKVQILFDKAMKKNPYLAFHVSSVAFQPYDKSMQNYSAMATSLQELHDKPAKVTLNPDKSMGYDIYDFSIKEHDYHIFFRTERVGLGFLQSYYAQTVRVRPKSDELKQMFRANPHQKVCFFAFTIEKDGNPYHDITSGTGNAVLVLSTVINTIREYVVKNTPDILTFGARGIEGEERSKYIAYTNIVRRLQKKYGYEVIEEIQGDIAFFFLMPSKGVRESEIELNSLLNEYKKGIY